MSLRLRTLPAGFIAPCLPISSRRPPSGDGWLHEIKHDGFRVIARKDRKRVKLYSRPGNDLTRDLIFGTDNAMQAVTGIKSEAETDGSHIIERAGGSHAIIPVAQLIEKLQRALHLDLRLC